MRATEVEQRKQRNSSRLEEASEDEDAKPLPVAFSAVVSKAPQIVTQAVALGQEATGLVIEKPDQVSNLVQTLQAAGGEGAKMVSAEKETAQAALQRVKEGASEVGDMAGRAKHNVKAATKLASATATDVKEGITEPSIPKLGSGAVEGTEATGNAMAVVAKSPLKAMAAVKDTALAAAHAVAVPLKQPKKAAKTAWQGTKAGGALAALFTAAPARARRTVATTAGAVVGLGSAATQAMGVANRMPGGKVLYYITLAVLMPWLLTAAVIGLVFGAAWEAVSQGLSFMGSCFAQAARVVGHRFRVEAEDLRTPHAPAPVPETRTATLDTAQAPAGPLDNPLDTLHARAGSLMLGSAGEALVEVRQRLEDEERAKHSPLRAAGRALGRARKGAGRAFRRLRFWRKPSATPLTTPPGSEEPSVHNHDSVTTSATGNTATATAGDATTTGHGVSQTARQSISNAVPSVSRHTSGLLVPRAKRGAVITPAGKLLPILALGMRDGPYSLHHARGVTPLSAQHTTTAATTDAGDSSTVAARTSDGTRALTKSIASTAASSPATHRRRGLFSTLSAYLHTALAAGIAVVSAVWDSFIALYEAAGGAGETDKRFRVRANHVCSLLLQPVVLVIGLQLAVLDTLLWLPYKVLQSLGWVGHSHKQHSPGAAATAHRGRAATTSGSTVGL